MFRQDLNANEYQLLANSVENSWLRIPRQKSTRLRLKSEFLAEGSSTRISRSRGQQRCFHPPIFERFGKTDFFKHNRPIEDLRHRLLQVSNLPT